MKKFILVILAFFLFITACDDTKEPACYDLGTINMATFNIQYLADSYDSGDTPRQAKDYAKIATLITDNELALIALQEIKSEESLNLLIDNGLPSRYKFQVGLSGGTQKLGILYDSDKIESIGTLVELDEEDGFAENDWDSVRSPLMAEVVIKGGTKFTMMVLHLKAGITEASVYKRFRQVEDVTNYITSISQEFDPITKKGIIILGDLNETFEGITDIVDPLQPLEDATDLGEFITEEISSEFTSLQFDDLIDHVFITNDLASDYVTGSVAPIKFDEDSSYDGFVISDHRPVKFTINVVGNCTQ
jgi:endonuclease/exonuclease/phosphatase family metal-dependent hydrolase